MYCTRGNQPDVAVCAIASRSVDYLTQPELIEQWLAKTDFAPKVGHRFRFFDKPSKRSER